MPRKEESSSPLRDRPGVGDQSQPNSRPIKCYPGDHPRIDVSKEWMEANDLRLCRTQQEILHRLKNNDIPFPWTAEVLIDYVEWQHAQDLITEECKARGPEAWTVVTDPLEAGQDFLDYMVFAWMKALDERGISAGRSIVKLGAWLWLLGRQDLEELINDDDLYNPYGAPALIKVCQELSITVPSDLAEFAEVPARW